MTKAGKTQARYSWVQLQSKPATADLQSFLVLPGEATVRHVDALLEMGAKKLEAGLKIAHVQYNHAWGEVSCKSRRIQSLRLPTSRTATNQQIIVQRGSFVSTLCDVARNRSHRLIDIWLCQSRQVRSTDAESLKPTITAAMPLKFLMADDLAELIEGVAEVSHHCHCYVDG